jgi:hypothetical protein
VEKKTATASEVIPLCPSAQTDWPGAVAFGVVAGSVEEPRVRHLAEPLPVTDQLLAMTHPLRATEVLRIAAPCAGSACVHFDGENCQLVTRITRLLPVVADALPPCSIRPTCRWWLQEGKSACMRCPQIVTDNYDPQGSLKEAIEPVAR